MKKNIVITGGLGYIGTELCKIYSGVSWNNNIVAIDNRFISERVNQLRNWGIEFINGDILDQDLLKKNEQKVLKAVKILFESSDDIEIFNKKAIYLYLREITGLNTKQVVNNLNKLRKRYKVFKGKWENGEI